MSEFTQMVISSHFGWLYDLHMYIVVSVSYKVVVPPTYAGWVQSRLDVRFLVESHACEQVNINQRL